MHQVEMSISSPNGYSLRAEHPSNGKTMVESYASLLAVVARASDLIQAGYSIGISSDPANVRGAYGQFDFRG